MVKTINIRRVKGFLVIKNQKRGLILTKTSNGVVCTEAVKTKNDKWITVKPHGEEEKGRHLLLEGDETPKQAMKRQWGVDIDRKKQQTLKAKKTSRYKEKTFEKLKDIEELKEKEKKANEALREEWGKDRWGAGDGEKINKLRDAVNKSREERRKLQSAFMNDLASSLKEELKNYSPKTDNLVKEISSLENNLKVYNDKYEQLKSERENIRQKAAKGEISEGKAFVLSVQNTQERMDIVEKIKRVKEEQILKNISIINKRDTGFELKSKTSSMGMVCDKLSKALGGFIGEDVVPEDAVVSVKKLRKGGRAFEREGEINITTESGLDVAIHEYMHFIEFKNPRVLMNSLAFAKMRTEGEATKNLKSITKNSGYKGEFSKPDNFFDPYCGKVYNSEDRQSYDNATASEILSMGAQRLFTEPKKFAEEDREYFDFVIASLKGDL